MYRYEERKELRELDIIKWFNSCCMCCAKCISYGTGDCSECCVDNDVDCKDCMLYNNKKYE